VMSRVAEVAGQQGGGLCWLPGKRPHLREVPWDTSWKGPAKAGKKGAKAWVMVMRPGGQALLSQKEFVPHEEAFRLRVAVLKREIDRKINY